MIIMKQCMTWHSSSQSWFVEHCYSFNYVCCGGTYLSSPHVCMCVVHMASTDVVSTIVPEDDVWWRNFACKYASYSGTCLRWLLC